MSIQHEYAETIEGSWKIRLRSREPGPKCRSPRLRRLGEERCVALYSWSRIQSHDASHRDSRPEREPWQDLPPWAATVPEKRPLRLQTRQRVSPPRRLDLPPWSGPKRKIHSLYAE